MGDGPACLRVYDMRIALPIFFKVVEITPRGADIKTLQIDGLLLQIEALIGRGSNSNAPCLFLGIDATGKISVADRDQVIVDAFTIQQMRDLLGCIPFPQTGEINIQIRHGFLQPVALAVTDQSKVFLPDFLFGGIDLLLTGEHAHLAFVSTKSPKIDQGADSDIHCLV